MVDRSNPQPADFATLSANSQAARLRSSSGGGLLPEARHPTTIARTCCREFEGASSVLSFSPNFSSNTDRFWMADKVDVHSGLGTIQSSVRPLHRDQGRLKAGANKLLALENGFNRKGKLRRIGL